MNSQERRLLIIALVVTTVLVVCYLLPNIATIVLLVFAGMVVAVLLETLTEAVRRVTRLPRPLALVVMAALAASVIAGLFLLISPQLTEEIPKLGHNYAPV